MCIYIYTCHKETMKAGFDCIHTHTNTTEIKYQFCLCILCYIHIAVLFYIPYFVIFAIIKIILIVCESCTMQACTRPNSLRTVFVRDKCLEMNKLYFTLLLWKRRFTRTQERNIIIGQPSHSFSDFSVRRPQSKSILLLG